jgi:hypothetical protein
MVARVGRSVVCQARDHIVRASGRTVATESSRAGFVAAGEGVHKPNACSGELESEDFARDQIGAGDHHSPRSPVGGPA